MSHLRCNFQSRSQNFIFFDLFLHLNIHLCAIGNQKSKQEKKTLTILVNKLYVKNELFLLPINITSQYYYCHRNDVR